MAGDAGLGPALPHPAGAAPQDGLNHPAAAGLHSDARLVLADGHDLGALDPDAHVLALGGLDVVAVAALLVPPGQEAAAEAAASSAGSGKQEII